MTTMAARELKRAIQQNTCQMSGLPISIALKIAQGKKIMPTHEDEETPEESLYLARHKKRITNAYNSY